MFAADYFSMQGFYFVYSEVFHNLAAMERAAYEERSLHEDLREPGPFPEFGRSDSEWKPIQSFYNFWLNFASVQDFGWMDQFHTASAPNRKVSKAIGA